MPFNDNTDTVATLAFTTHTRSHKSLLLANSPLTFDAVNFGKRCAFNYKSFWPTNSAKFITFIVVRMCVWACVCVFVLLGLTKSYCNKFNLFFAHCQVLARPAYPVSAWGSMVFPTQFRQFPDPPPPHPSIDTPTPTHTHTKTAHGTCLIVEQFL